MNGTGTKRRKWEHAGFLLLLALFAAWYLWDCASTAFTFDNLILVGPVAVLALVLALRIGIVELLGFGAVSSGKPQARDALIPATRTKTGSDRVSIMMMVLFALFIILIPYGGFDAASFCFITSVLWLLGERRLYFVLPLALGVSLGISFLALALLTYPVPTLVAGRIWGLL